MDVRINDITYDVPFDPAMITLEDFLSYKNEYGNDLDKRLRDIVETTYSDDVEQNNVEKAYAIEAHLDLEALCWYSFWTKFDLVEAKGHPGITPLLEQYRVLKFLFNDDPEEQESFPQQVTWNDEEWVISDFKINPASDMSFNEIITSKEVVRQIHAIEKGKWDAMPYLCAIFFRKKNEIFSDELISEEGERMTLLKKLPMNYALSVAFFLNIYVSFWTNTSAFLAKRALETQSQN